MNNAFTYQELRVNSLHTYGLQSPFSMTDWLMVC